MALVLPKLSYTEKLRVAKYSLRVLRGSASATPTPVTFRVADVGLLYFLNQKQAQLHEAVAALHFSADDDEMEAVRNMLEFVRFIVGGLIVEAERIDEAVIAVKKEVTSVATELRRIDVELQYQRPRLGTHVEQAIAQHYKMKLAVPQRSSRPFLENLNTCENEQLGDLPSAMVSMRAQLQYLKAHLHALKTVQKLLHGSGERIPEAEAVAIVSEVDIVSTFRKSAHKVRDAVVGLRGREDLVAVASLLEFFEMLISGMVAATAATVDLEYDLNKKYALEMRNRSIAALDVVDARNKKLSAEALQLNEVLASRVLDRTAASDTRLDVTTAPSIAVRGPTHSPSVVQFLSEYCA